MKLAIRADAYKSLGTGHLLRSLALAQGLKDSGCDTVFLTYCDPERLTERLTGEVFKTYPLQKSDGIEKTMAILEKENPEWVVLDGYHFGTDYQKTVKGAGFRLMVIDDFAHLDRYHADIILNQNYGAERFRYSAGPHAKLLIGARYVLLRREFLKYGNLTREIPDVAGKLLITLGGGDPENNTLKALRAANLVETRLDIKVIVGASNPHYESIRGAAEESGHNVEVLAGVEDMAPFMAWADLAVSAGGTTVWELAFMGLPALLCIVADNQEGAVGALHRDGVFRSAGWIGKLTDRELSDELAALIYGKDLRTAIHNKAKAIVDGKGASRVVGEMQLAAVK